MINPTDLTILTTFILLLDDGFDLNQVFRRRKYSNDEDNDNGGLGVGLHQQGQQRLTMALVACRERLLRRDGPRQRRTVIFRTDHWWSIDVLQHFTNSQWRKNFRMGQATFNYLTDILEPYIGRLDNPFGRNIPTKKLVGMALYRLSTNCDLRTIANLFGVSCSTVCEVVHSVCSAITEFLQPRYIVWPEGQRLTETVNGFQQFHGFPQCVGAIDGSHIPIIAPYDRPNDYYNRKGHHSIVLQAVTDHMLRFTNIYVGWPGRVHDSRILRNSEIFAKAENRQLLPVRTELISGVQVPLLILGDPAYPLKTWLMKGFPGENLPRQQQTFNYRLSRARMVVERSFGMLKGRWRLLMKRNDSLLKHVPNMVVACCVLHNFCIEEGEIYNPEWDVVDEQPQVEPLRNAAEEVSGTDIRAALVRYFQE
ncbi:protein ANTAGONIST OF LIKE HETEROCHROMATIN PROTEIN 1-like [Anneissia japonica]|uniref:protein ANTAGONIST OF LIKE HETEROCHROMATIN PROTEIN 1-like n=1 Tax=Anneissia japonica TaxID=1529436 RepID=UPI001425B860|nr:protein ANTAGONIST OF LIKE HETEROCHROMATIN PROTEIN 1-like [Anneissia japonica]